MEYREHREKKKEKEKENEHVNQVSFKEPPQLTFWNWFITKEREGWCLWVWTMQ